MKTFFTLLILIWQSSFFPRFKKDQVRRTPLQILAALFFLCSLSYILLPLHVYSQPLNWEQVNSDGFGDYNNISGYHMTVFDGQLYLSTRNKSSGTEIWRSPNGLNWEQVNSDGFGDSNNTAGSFVSFSNFLYLLTNNRNTGTEVWRTQNGVNWQQINDDGFGDRNNTSASGRIVYASLLYITTFNESTGTEIWRTPNGLNWEQVNSDGFGDSNNIDSGCIPFGSYLYCMVGSYFAFEVWRTLDGIAWENVNNGGWEDATALAGVSIFEGFMYISTCPNAKIWRTNDGKTWYEVPYGSNGNNICANFLMVPGYTFRNSLYFTTTNNVTGLEIWKSSDGIMWTQVVFRGFGDTLNNGGFLVVFRDYLYVLTSNHSSGTEVWRTQNGLYWEQVKRDGFGDANNSMESNIAIFKDSFYIATYNTVTGTELWKTDGSPISGAPTAMTFSATAMTPTSAIFNGAVNPNGQKTTYYFEYGTGTSYGFNTSPSSAGSGTSAVAVEATISGLASNTTYHYRLVATNSSGTSYGNDENFSTNILYVELSGLCGGKTPCYSSIQSAIDAASSGAIIKIAQGAYIEDLSLSSSKKLTLSAGWDSTFTTQPATSSVESMTINDGGFTIDGIEIQ